MAEVQNPTSSFAERDIDPWKKGRAIVGFRHEFPESWLTVRLARHESIRLSCNCTIRSTIRTDPAVLYNHQLRRTEYSPPA